MTDKPHEEARPPSQPGFLASLAPQWKTIVATTAVVSAGWGFFSYWMVQLSNERLQLAERARAGKAVLILRNTGQVVTDVTVLEKEFRVETPDLQTLAFPQGRVKTIVYKNLPTFPTDMLRTSTGSEFNGTVLNDPINVEAADLGGRTKIAKERLISIIW